ncbi:MAG: CpaF family protein [Candidatus Micrarchaeota archaeon]|nr:CpaF family protein [Candidatus Micrarchaeota archaeon]
MKVIEKYTLRPFGVPVKIKIISRGLVPEYIAELPEISEATKAILESIKDELITEVHVEAEEILDPKSAEEIRRKFEEKAYELVKKKLPKTSENEREILVGLLLQNTIGLGILEIPLNDDSLEEIAVNSSSENVYVYHRKLGWLKTNLSLNSETEIQNLAASIGRRVGRRITVLDPLMDAQLVTGDRVNATLFPISTKGNTITIRKFARKPWTITEFIQNRTMNLELAAFLWQAIHYEMNIIFAGGTATGKTSLLNVVSTFIPPNHRIVSIEDTREIKLPKTLHWVPLTTREPNPEGKGGVTMLELMINSLRMRPDRIIVGEVRRAEEAEVLFEAMHTGHSVYSTFHAETSSQVIRRLTHPPMEIPETLLESLHLVAVMYRDRRKNIRRLFEVSEIMPGSEKTGISVNTVFRWSPSRDEIVSYGSSRVIDELSLHTGLSEKELKDDLETKKKVLEKIVKAKVDSVDGIGKIIGSYYSDPDSVIKKSIKKIMEEGS